MSVGLTHTFAVTITNKVYSWHNLDNSAVVALVEGLEQVPAIVDIKSGNAQTIILSSDHKVYRVEHPTETEKPCKAEQMKKLNNIVLIAGNLAHFLALEREDIPPLKEWNSAKVAEWFTGIGLEDCANLIKYKNITGEIILNADEDYM